MPTPEEMKAAQEAEAAAQAAAAAAQAETEVPPATETDDPKALKAENERLRRIATANGKEAAKYRVQARDAAEAKRKAEEAALTEQGKFKELSESRGKEIEALKQELEPLRSTAAVYQQREAEEQQRRASQVNADFAALPEEIRGDIPADADLRTKEIAVRTYQRASGKASPKPPTTPLTAPRPPDGGQPPVTADQVRRANQCLGNPRSSKEDQRAAREVLEKHRAWQAAHPGQ